MSDTLILHTIGLPLLALSLCCAGAWGDRSARGTDTLTDRTLTIGFAALTYAVLVWPTL